jgi:uncharacterized OB-fold protein
MNTEATQGTAPVATRTISVAPEQFRISEDGSTGTLLGSRCKECKTAFFGPTRYCRRCTSDRVEPIELSGEGVLRSHTLIFRAPSGWTGPEPYALAEVELPEGVAVRSRLTDWTEGEQLEIGSSYEVVVTPVGQDEEGNVLAAYTWSRTGSRS